jgi:predicted TIM-barrel fold metal-dependent hydrolase
MIVDCHTRIWASPAQLGQAAGVWLNRHGRQAPCADAAHHLDAARQVQATLVWGFRSRAIGADVPNALVAEHVAQHSQNMLGIAAVDPPEPDALERLQNVAAKGEFAGITISPAGQGFHPADTRAMAIYELCAQRGLPVFVDAGADYGPAAVLEFARPHLFDEVARAFPSLTLVLGEAGWPWVDETLALLAKHTRVYAEVGGLLGRSWDAYVTMVKAHQFGVGGKLLFGSDFPFSKPDDAIERLYRINETAHGTNLPTVPREVLRGIVEREALAELGIKAPPPAPSA